MFRRLRQARHLRAIADQNAARVGYSGRTARIARIHQEGLSERITPGGPLVQYPQRRLIGWSDDDRQWVLDEAREHLAART
jgi:phage virion morphogenesis protein